jgi:hypothetical protein
MGFVRAVIQFALDLVEPLLRNAAEVSAPWEILAQQAIDVLNRPTLPRGVRIAEVDGHTQAAAKPVVFGHLTAAVVSHAATQMRGCAAKLAGELLAHMGGVTAMEFDQPDTQRQAHDDDAQERLALGTDQQIALEMTGLDAKIHLGGTLRDGQEVLNWRKASVRAVAVAAATGATAQRAG